MKNTVAEWHKSHKIFTTTAILLCMFLGSNPIEKMLNKKKFVEKPISKKLCQMKLQKELNTKAYG